MQISDKTVLMNVSLGMCVIIFSRRDLNAHREGCSVDEQYLLHWKTEKNEKVREGKAPLVLEL